MLLTGAPPEPQDLLQRPQTQRLSSRFFLTARTTSRSVKIFMPNGPWLSGRGPRSVLNPGLH